jgi:dihydroorotase
LFDLSIHGMVYTDRLAEGWVYVADGKIAKVSRERSGRAVAEMALSDSQFLFPAATDLHVHLRDWSQRRKETVETGTKSAVAGGVTTVADMPNTEPRMNTAEAVEKRIELMRAKSFADFALHAGAPDSPGHVAALARAGAFALKLYPPELGRFPELLKEASRARMKLAVHAEEFGLIGTESGPLAEGVAIRKILGQLPASSQVRFAHVSTSDGASELVAARRSHKGLTMEVAPHHLFMSDGVAEERIGVTRRVNPSLRPPSNVVRMRRMLRSGAFDFYATDHAPHTVEEKFQGAPGFPSLELALPLFLTKTKDLGLVSRMYCEAPAAYLGLPKGKISPGYWADLVVVGRRSWKVDPERFVSKGRVTPFAGETMRYSVEHVFKAGSTVFADDKFKRVPSRLVSDGHLH